MRIAYLNYSKGFNLEELYNLISNSEVYEKQSITLQMLDEKWKELNIDRLYLPFLKINLDDLSSIPLASIQEIPIKITSKVASGFTHDAFIWLTKHALFFEGDHESYIFESKLEHQGLELLTFMEKENEKEGERKYTVGRSNKGHIDKRMIKIEVTLDDMNPEFYGFIIERLFEIGVNDVYIAQVLMKKNRPGQILHVLCQEEIKDKVITLLFEETTTLGIRLTPFEVHRLERKFYSVETKWGTANVKLGLMNGEVIQISPEYNECVELAKSNKVPLKLIYDTVKNLGYEKLKKK